MSTNLIVASPDSPLVSRILYSFSLTVRHPRAGRRITERRTLAFIRSRGIFSNISIHHGKCNASFSARSVSWRVVGANGFVASERQLVYLVTPPAFYSSNNQGSRVQSEDSVHLHP